VIRSTVLKQNKLNYDDYFVHDVTRTRPDGLTYGVWTLSSQVTLIIIV